MPDNAPAAPAHRNWILAGLALVSWVFSIYLVAQTVTIPIYGKLSDLFERSFAWLDKNRRLWKNCERFLNTSLRLVHLAFLALLIRRS
ncbi:MAG: hypothetical protein BGO13_14170 [Burkholderiales bacterium 66-5]|nr:MAG: hypothetical protein BGO13_14170 [Burkholderiales bacterium 66-5]